jgi:hypothetical protein
LRSCGEGKTTHDDCISEGKSKVFELLEGGAAARKAGRRKLNVFARWARAKFYSRSHDAVIRFFDESGALIETHESEGAFLEP